MKSILFKSLILSIGFLFSLSVIKAQTLSYATYTAQGYSVKSMTTTWDTVNAQSAPDTIDIANPFHTYGHWAGSAWLEIDTLTGNLGQQSGSFSVQESGHRDTGSYENCYSQTEGSNVATISLTSPTPDLGSVITFRTNGPRVRYRTIVADGVIRYRWKITLYKE